MIPVGLLEDQEKEDEEMGSQQMLDDTKDMYKQKYEHKSGQVKLRVPKKVLLDLSKKKEIGRKMKIEKMKKKKGKEMKNEKKRRRDDEDEDIKPLQPVNKKRKFEQSDPPSMIFKGSTFAVSCLAGDNRSEIRSIVDSLGGKYTHPLNDKHIGDKTYLVCPGDLVNPTPKVEFAIKNKIKIVDAKWVKECSKRGEIVSLAGYLLFLQDDEEDEANMDTQVEDDEIDDFGLDGFIVDEDVAVLLPEKDILEDNDKVFEENVLIAEEKKEVKDLPKMEVKKLIDVEKRTSPTPKQQGEVKKEDIEDDLKKSIIKNIKSVMSKSSDPKKFILDQIDKITKIIESSKNKYDVYSSIAKKEIPRNINKLIRNPTLEGESLLQNLRKRKMQYLCLIEEMERYLSLSSSSKDKKGNMKISFSMESERFYLDESIGSLEVATLRQQIYFVRGVIAKDVKEATYVLVPKEIEYDDELVEQTLSKYEKKGVDREKVLSLDFVSECIRLNSFISINAFQLE